MFCLCFFLFFCLTNSNLWCLNYDLRLMVSRCVFVFNFFVFVLFWFEVSCMRFEVHGLWFEVGSWIKMNFGSDSSFGYGF